MSEMLKIKSVSKKLGNQLVLDHCSLEVEKGSILGIIGVNGAGKSTLLRCIAGVYRCDQGSITLNGQEIYENEQLKKDILFLSDQPYFANNDTLKSLKEFYMVFYDRFNEEKYRSYLKMTKLDENKALRSFSKGMRRQAFIILMLSLSPKLLILDESFDGLDPLMKVLMKKVLTNLVVDEETIVLISSHSLSDIESICDHYVIMDHNTICDLEEMDMNKTKNHRIQLAFSEEKTVEDFANFDVVNLDIQGRVVNLVVEGELEAIETTIKEMNPLMVDYLDITLEELFIAKMEGLDNE
ncbi:MAG: ABC transporter ATP-binding protein [Erysipelotrichia bacterium]|nr:ABC transporter ATP-binding protein [Erysipelotrichia bacterium]NCC54072.1 ABC transporter ATP-binding protein [Erysipelotrichia bacterium]